MHDWRGCGGEGWGHGHGGVLRRPDDVRNIVGGQAPACVPPPNVSYSRSGFLMSTRECPPTGTREQIIARAWFRRLGLFAERCGGIPTMDRVVVGFGFKHLGCDLCASVGRQSGG